MRNSIIRKDNWLVRSECALSNGTFGGIFETQVNTKGEHTHTPCCRACEVENRRKRGGGEITGEGWSCGKANEGRQTMSET